MRRFSFLMGAFLVMAISMGAVASGDEANNPEHADPVLLTIRGLPDNVPGLQNGTLKLNMEGLEKFPVTRFETNTIWTNGEQSFAGLEIVDLLRELDLPTQDVTAAALNGYQIVIPAKDIVEGGAMIAYERNGSPMTRRDKGPLWIVYPFDDNSDYRTEVTYSQSVWQLTDITLGDLTK